MKSWIIITGDEILHGKTLDYNSYWISKRLSGIGVDVKRKITVPDEKHAITEAIRSALKRADLIVTIGGLGPTPRDETLSAVADAMGKPLTLNDKALHLVSEAYKRLHQLGFVSSPEINEARRKMANLPEGATPLRNEVGGAPAVMTQCEGPLILSLPGIPSEMMYTLEQAVPLLSERIEAKGVVRTRELYIEKRDESLLAEVFEKVMDQIENVEIKSYPVGFGKRMQMRIIAVAHADSPEKAEKKLDEAVSFLKTLIGQDLS